MWLPRNSEDLLLRDSQPSLPPRKAFAGILLCLSAECLAGALFLVAELASLGIQQPFPIQGMIRLGLAGELCEEFTGGDVQPQFIGHAASSSSPVSSYHSRSVPE